MRIVVAPDKFKGSLRASEVASALSRGLRSTGDLEGLEVIEIPVADGGEGTVDAAVGSGGFRRRTVTVTGPVGLPIQASYAIRGADAVIELAQASGLDGLPRDQHGALQRDALGASSHGTGDLIADALATGCTRIVLGVGGSACTDGGAGLLTALGARFLDAEDAPVPPGGGPLSEVAQADLTSLDPRIREAEFVLAADVDNPLLGDNGASAVFGPQKGADPAGVAVLERGLATLRDRLADSIGAGALSVADMPGAGAAGGVGFAALAVLGATRRPGIDVILDFVQLPEQVRGADLVLTGEGSLDAQSLGGKTPIGVLRTAQAAGVPTIAVCGRTLLTDHEAREAGFQAVHALTDLEPDPDICIRDAAALLHRTGALIAATHRRTPA